MNHTKLPLCMMAAVVLALPLVACDPSIASLSDEMDDSENGAGSLAAGAIEVTDSAVLGKDEWRHYGPFNASGGSVRAAITGTGDADLYVKVSGRPSLGAYDCRPYASSARETCTTRGTGPVYVSVHAYSAAAFKLKVQYAPMPTVSAGQKHTCSLTQAGGVKCWGGNDRGQVGDGTSGTNRLSPVDVLGLNSGVYAVSAGSEHTCALTTAGGVKCWGVNGWGEMGDGTRGTDRLAPVEVVGLQSGVAAISAGEGHTCALTTAGGVKCWGTNSRGEVGDGTTIDRVTPVNVVGLSSGVVAIASGATHSCALTIAGGIKCWGSNERGQLGDGTIDNDRFSPVDVLGLTSGVASVAGGERHTCAITAGGGVKCWGINDTGQVGDGSGYNDRLAPVDVSGLSSGMAIVSAGWGHTCALTAAGGAKCWGYDGQGQLGGGRPGIIELTPGDVLGLSSGVRSISAGWSHTCAVINAGTIKCWGDNDFGQVGDGTSGTDRSTPVDVGQSADAGVSTDAGAPDAGECPGQDPSIDLNHNTIPDCKENLLANGQFTTGTTPWASTPRGSIEFSSPGAGSGAARIVNTVRSTSVNGGEVLSECIPVNALSGYGVYLMYFMPAGQPGGDDGAAAWSTVQTYSDSMCSVPEMSISGSTLGTMKDSWSTYTRLFTTGWNSHSARISLGVLKGATTSDVEALFDNVLLVGPSGVVSDAGTPDAGNPLDAGVSPDAGAPISSGGSHACALTAVGGVKCWGYNADGQIGDGTSGVNRLTPVSVMGLGARVTSISSGSGHTCALTSSGGIKCWGRNDHGQVGDGTIGTNRLTPESVTGLGSGVTSISSGWGHTCALTSAGGVKCWGNNNYGQIGDGTSGTSRVTPVSVPGLESGVTSVSSGAMHTCALTTSGGVKCWGYNGYGAVGDGTIGTSRKTPVSVTGLASGVTSISSGESHNCALTSVGGVKCWGSNYSGQTGDGSSGTNRLTPVSVTGLGSGVTSISLGAMHSCALTTAGGVKCWGNNDDGQVGDGSSGSSRLTPASVTSLASGVSFISSGWGHTCALTSAGSVKCWGNNKDGQVGDGTSDNDRLTPVDVLP